MKFNKYRQMQWTDTEMSRKKRKKKAQSLINKQDYESINKKIVCIVAVA